MKAGREMDALVAEKVMGWCAVSVKPKMSSETTDWWFNDKQAICPCFNYEPSVDIRQAWQVVEKLAERHVISVACVINRQWRCEIVQAHSQRQIPANAIADTAPLAICLAALKACGVEVESPK